MHIEEESISMAKPRQIVEKENALEGMMVVYDRRIYVELEEKHKAEIRSEMLETMRSLKDDLHILKADNVKLMNARLEQEDINELILKKLIDQAP